MEEDKKLEEYLNTLTCRGCYNQCSLNHPSCGKSRIWINEAIEKYNSQNTK